MRNKHVVEYNVARARAYTYMRAHISVPFIIYKMFHFIYDKGLLNYIQITP